MSAKKTKIFIDSTTPTGEIRKVLVGEIKEINGEKYFFKRVDSVIHLMRRNSSYGIDLGVFNSLDVVGIYIYEYDTDTRLYADLSVWKEHGFREDLRYGEQMFLSKAFMEER